ncbi:MAG: pilus assembly protein [Pararhodobacter sp.]|nr:pilus assembly protein [Pararhodobacter sp.]
MHMPPSRQDSDRRSPFRSLARFRRDTRGTVSVETIIILPLLLWALVATVVFFDAFRTRQQVQTAALSVADLISRETAMVTPNYLEGMNDVFDFLAASRRPTRMRISSLIWNSAEQRNRVQWSYGTRGMAPLADPVFAMLAANDHQSLLQFFGDDESFSFAGAQAQMPTPDLIDRIPPILPGEAVILVESFALWSPFVDVGFAQRRITHVVATRPRFAPWIHLEGSIPVFPEDAYEMVIADDDDDDDDDDPVCEQPGDPGCPTGTTDIVDTSFDDATGPGTTGWSHHTVSQGGASVGRFLGPFGRETFHNPVTYSVHLGAPAVSATIDFDLVIIDSWDGYNRDWSDMRGDNMTIMIDGTPISLDVFNVDYFGFYRNPRRAEGVLNGMRYTVEMTPISHGIDLYGGGWHDQLWRVVLTLEAPPWRFDVGFSANLDEDVNNESFGISRFRVQADHGTPVPAAFTPDPATLLGTDHHTRFPIYGGCPDHRLPAPWLSVNNTDLASPLIIQRRAGGDTRLQDCGTLPGWGWAQGSPHLVLRYDNEGQSGTNRRLRLRMQDNNAGRSCDTTFLVRDPSGQWWFNDDISSSDWNAWLNMGNAETGDYHIWIGTWGGNSCDADLRLERY